MPELTTKPGATARCPACGNWIARVDSAKAEVEANCGNPRCKTAVKIIKENGNITVEVIERRKQA